MQNQLPTVLVVEDDKRWQDNYRDSLKDVARVIAASTPGEAYDLFYEHRQDIALIVMDGSLLGGGLDTLPLVREFRNAGFNGPMIAASSNKEWNAALMDGGKGCDHNSEKYKAPGYALEVLQSGQPRPFATPPAPQP
jgi:CheY-like chemotaxis protein